MEAIPWSVTDVDSTDEASAVEFDETFFPAASRVKADLSRFARRNPVLPGIYEVDVWLNEDWQARRPLTFAPMGDGGDAEPCLDDVDLEAWGVAVSEVNDSGVTGSSDESCVPIARRVAGAESHMDIAEQRLDITVPQASMVRVPRGYVPPERWEPGVDGGRLAWRLNAHRFISERARSTSGFLAIEPGINVGAWRLRHAGVAGSRGYRSSGTFIQRDAPRWRSQWRIGDVSTRGDVFSPVRLRGVTLASDPRMSAESTSGFAPAIRGIAMTHAQVRIHQRGTLIHEVSVPPGPFVIDDLYATGSGGDLEVTVDERDGRRSSFRVPSTTMAGMLRQGRSDITVGLGDVAVQARERRQLFQMTWRRGVGDALTLHTGLVGSYGHREAVVGAVVGSRLGAVGMDLATSRTGRPSRTGRILRARFVRRFGADVHLVVNLTQPLGSDYRSLDDSLRDRDEAGAVRLVEVAAQYSLPGGGSLNVSATTAWRRPAGSRDMAYDVGWSNQWGRSTVSLNVQRTQTAFAGRQGVDLRAQASFSVALGAASSHALGVSMDAARAQRTGRSIHVSGTTPGDGDYIVSLGRGQNGMSRGTVAMSRTYATGEAGIIADADATSRGLSLSASGGAVVHAGGFAAGPRLGDAVALVSADGAAGARLTSTPSARLDRRGRGVASQLVPYRWNSVDIDPSGLSLDVDVRSTHRRVVPTAGAILDLRFETATGRTLLVESRRVTGDVLPFGAEVVDHDGRSVGVVGQAGRVFVRTDRPLGEFVVRWGDAPGETCRLRVPMGTSESGEWLRRVQAVCE